MKRIVSLGLVAVVGTVLGCSSSVPDAQPKNANPNAVSRVQRATTNAGGGAGAGTKANTQQNVKE